MKRLYKILILIVVAIGLIVGAISINNRNVIRSVKSEKQLLEFSKNRYSEMSNLERVLTLPFSLFIYNYKYSYGGRYYIEDTIDYATNDSAELSVNDTKDYSKTNVQVEGVDEADIIKTDGDYIYSISDNYVIVTNTKDPNNTFIETKIYTDSSIPNDLLLYDKYLVVFAYSTSNSSNGRYYYRYSYNKNTLVEVYDVSDKSNIKRVKSFELYEPYYTSRCIDGNLYVFSKGYLRVEDNKVEREYKDDMSTKEIALKDIKYLKDNRSSIQTLIAHLDLNNIGEVDVKSYLIDIANAYVSKNNIYLLDYIYEDHISIGSIFTFKGIIGFIKDSDEYDYSTKSKIYKFEITKDKGVVFNSATTIKGSTINQYSMDEKDNHLRIALETNKGTRIAILNEKLKLIGETDSVAKGERMYASRFIGNRAYLVTYRNTDPLFVVDLTNESSPKVMGELKIPGYSTYLHPYDENHLIGIGMDTEEIIERDYNGKVISNWVRTNGMKMCLFDVSDITNPKEISKTTIGDRRAASAILSNPKALLFSKEKNLLAIPVNNYKEDFSVTYSDDYSSSINSYKNYNKDYISEGYFVYNVDLINGFKLKGIISHEKKTYNYDYYYYRDSKLLRGVYIDNNLYTVSENYVKVNSLEDLSEISSINIKEN